MLSTKYNVQRATRVPHGEKRKTAPQTYLLSSTLIYCPRCTCPSSKINDFPNKNLKEHTIMIDRNMRRRWCIFAYGQNVLYLSWNVLEITCRTRGLCFSFVNYVLRIIYNINICSLTLVFTFTNEGIVSNMWQVLPMFWGVEAIVMAANWTVYWLVLIAFWYKTQGHNDGSSFLCVRTI